MRWCGPLLLTVALLVGCDQEALPARALTVGSALSGSPEQLELEPTAQRADLFRQVVQESTTESGQKAGAAVLFPLAKGEELLGAPALEAHADLMQSWDAGIGTALDLGSSADVWTDEPHEALQGLSEREAAALVASGLLQRWGIQAQGTVRVDRVMGAPYAAAYVDGVLRVNPSFLYLASAGTALP